MEEGGIEGEGKEGRRNGRGEEDMYLGAGTMAENWWKEKAARRWICNGNSWG